MTLIVEDGTGLANADAYVSVAGSDAYHLAHGAPSAWVGVRASQVLTVSANPANDETVTVGSKVYTFKTTLTDTDGFVLIGPNAASTLSNLAAAIGLGSGAGTVYAASTTAHPAAEVSAQSATTVTVRALAFGATGNAIATTETMGDGSNVWTAATMSGGAEPTIPKSKKEENLRIGAAWLDFTFGGRLKGTRINGTMSLLHPRYNVRDRDGYSVASDAVPVQVENANAIIALEAESGALVVNVDAGAGSVARDKLKVGPITIETDFAGAAQLQATYTEVERILAGLLSPFGKLERA